MEKSGGGGVWTSETWGKRKKHRPLYLKSKGIGPNKNRGGAHLFGPGKGGHSLKGLLKGGRDPLGTLKDEKGKKVFLSSSG